MPYGLPKDKDTDTNNSKMERCVEQVMKKNSKLSKSSAIAICKSSLGFTKSTDELWLEVTLPS